MRGTRTRTTTRPACTSGWGTRPTHCGTSRRTERSSASAPTSPPRTPSRRSPMSEPTARAAKIPRVAPGPFPWPLHDDRIDFRSDAHAVTGRRGAVLIDPLPLTDAALAKIGRVEAICLTGSCHQRSAWRYRRLLGVPVHAPRGAKGLEERPDAEFEKGARLPGGLVAVHAPGPTHVHYAFHRRAGRGIVFCADVLTREGDGVRFIEDAYQDEPRVTRKTARSLLVLRFGILCFNHGAPMTRGAKRAIRAATASG